MFSNGNGRFLMKKILLLITLIFLFTNISFAQDCQSADECTLLGRKLIQEKKYKKAIECFDFAITEDNEEYLAYAYRAKANFYLKNYNKTLDDTKKSLEICENSTAHGLRASVNLVKGNYHDSIEEATKAIELNPWYMKCYEVRARAELNLKDYFSALKDSSKAIKIRNDYPKSYEVRGYAYLGLKDIPSAKSDFAQAAELYKDTNDSKNYKQMTKMVKICQRKME